MGKGAGWTEDHLKDLLSQGKIKGYKLNGKPGDPPKKSRRAKYNNEKVEWNGEVFDSIKEYKYYRQLLLRLKAGEIGMLQRQVVYELIPKMPGQRRCTYKADFVYIEAATGEKKVVDTKGVLTEVFNIKRKLMKEKHGIEIIVM